MLIVSVYKKDADNSNLLDVANDFYAGGSHSLLKFGHFSEADLRWTFS